MRIIASCCPTLSQIILLRRFISFIFESYLHKFNITDLLNTLLNEFFIETSKNKS